MSYPEEEYLMISGIQHFSFCRRQWALIHLEQQWQENYLTAEGQVLHTHAHNEDFIEKRPGKLILRGIRVASSELGMSGHCDVLECTQAAGGAALHGRKGYWQILPVEYKHGRSKSAQCDRIQLCCEAMCLEEMLACTISEGALYYHAARRREKVLFTKELRQTVQQMAEEMHRYYDKGQTPKVKPGKQCQSCSLKEICLPRVCRQITAKSYYQEMLGES